MNALPAPSESLIDARGQLAPAEVRLMHEALFDEEKRLRTKAAKAIIRDALQGAQIGWEELREDTTRGEVAARLWATWGGRQREEPLVECDYAVTGIYVDLERAMLAHGTAAFAQNCEALGRRMAEACIEYVLSCHGNDADEVEAGLRQDAEDERELMRCREWDEGVA